MCTPCKTRALPGTVIGFSVAAALLGMAHGSKKQHQVMMRELEVLKEQWRNEWRKEVIQKSSSILEGPQLDKFVHFMTHDFQQLSEAELAKKGGKGHH